jgi:hypothetical protein
VVVAHGSSNRAIVLFMARRSENRAKNNVHAELLVCVMQNHGQTNSRPQGFTIEERIPGTRAAFFSEYLENGPHAGHKYASLCIKQEASHGACASFMVDAPRRARAADAT